MGAAGRVFVALVAVVVSTAYAWSASSPPDEGGFELDHLVPGATSAALETIFGAARLAETDEGTQVSREDYALPARGYARVTAWFGVDGKLFAGRVLPKRSLKPAAAALLFDLHSVGRRTAGHGFTGANVGHLVTHAAEGVHFFEREGRVEELWRTAVHASPENLKRRLGATCPVAPLAVPESVAVAEAGEAPTAPPTPDAPLRCLWLEPPLASVVQDDQGYPAIVLTAVVHADGLRDQNIRFEGFLRPYPGGLDYAPVLEATDEAPAEVRDEHGILHPRNDDTVLYDTSRFGSPTVIFPLQYLEGDGRAGGHFQASFEVVCGGLAAFDSVVVSVPGPLLSNDVQVMSVAAGYPTAEGGEREGMGPGFFVNRKVESTMARGQTVTTHALLRRADGQPVLAADGWDSWRLDDGQFYALGSDEALYDQSAWDPFQVFVPVAALDLEPGTHRLILRSQTGIRGLAGAHERELIVSIPTPAGTDESGGGR